jgi:hypothetical protein
VTPTLPARTLPSWLRPLWLGFGLTAAVVIVVAVMAGTATDYHGPPAARLPDDDDAR